MSTNLMFAVARVEYVGQEPFRAHPSDAGADLELKWNARIPPSMFAKLELTTRVNIPEGYYGQLTLRSGMASRGLIGHVGTIDAGYTGPLRLIVGNLSGHVQVLWAGERVAQLTILPIPPVTFVEADQLPTTDRGQAGFGSTGTRRPA